MMDMNLALFNTFTRERQPFRPVGSEVSLYACGITPYDTTHLGHAFTYCGVDVLHRYLEFSGCRVKYVQNVTDIDDDILKRAGEVGEDWLTLGNRWTRHFIQDMKTLNVLPPTHYPRATDVIPQIQASVEALIEVGVAYVVNGSVYFNIHAWEEFGKLTRLTYEKMLPIANERGNDPTDSNKKDPLDFVLWQAQRAGEPAWDSPWGTGRPGWHIECSTLSEAFLGLSIDIHMGGADLAFPHHECEIAQIEPLTGEPFVRFWLHVAMVEHEGEKMSKSLGNLVMVRDLLKEWSPNEIRAYLASHHYRVGWAHSEAGLASARMWVGHLMDAAQLKGAGGPSCDVSSYRMAFQERMDDDLDTPGAMGVLAEMADFIQGCHAGGSELERAQRALMELTAVVGIRLEDQAVESGELEGWEIHERRFARSS